MTRTRGRPKKQQQQQKTPVPILYFSVAVRPERISTECGAVRISADQFGAVRISADQFGSVRIDAPGDTPGDTPGDDNDATAASGDRSGLSDTTVRV